MFGLWETGILLRRVCLWQRSPCHLATSRPPASLPFRFYGGGGGQWWACVASQKRWLVASLLLFTNVAAFVRPRGWSEIGNKLSCIPLCWFPTEAVKLWNLYNLHHVVYIIKCQVIIFKEFYGQPIRGLMTGQLTIENAAIVRIYIYIFLVQFIYLIWGLFVDDIICTLISSLGSLLVNMHTQHSKSEHRVTWHGGDIASCRSFIPNEWKATPVCMVSFSHDYKKGVLAMYPRMPEVGLASSGKCSCNERDSLRCQCTWQN